MQTDILLPQCITRDFLLAHRVCPVGRTPQGQVEIAVEEDSDLSALDDLSVAYDAPVAAVPQAPAELTLLIERLSTRMERSARRLQSDEQDLGSDIRDLANQPPVVRYVNLLIRDGFAAGASDIHLESTETAMSVRYRVDGMLRPAIDPPSDLERAVVSRVKLLASMDIAERRRPQDGRIRMRLEDRDLDLRVSTTPTLHGESVVLRLLDRAGTRTALETLGMPEPVKAAIAEIACRPHGLILTTGPTGSGKTTTLYSLLALRQASVEKIITLEDPIEHPLPEVTQIPINAAAGVEFAGMLRSVLRQDPDVILVGEMRDAETAEVAVQAALTGHLVLSSLHTNDAIGAIARLSDLRIPPFLIAATLECIIGQRLVRVVCSQCRVTRPTFGSAAQEPPRVGSPVGGSCELCAGTGYSGRTGVFELVRLSPEVKEAVAAAATRAEITRLARAAGWVPLLEDGRKKVALGLTTDEEVNRVAAA